MSEKRINLANFIEKSRVNGPGVRAVVWVQGCHFHCPGCFNQENQSFKKKNLVSVSELAYKILMIEGIDGVTFSGGEPFNQAAALSEIAAILKEHGLTVMIFTGYTYRELKAGNRKSWNKLLAHTDLLVAGRFVQAKTVKGIPLIGSSNQEIVSITGKIGQPEGNSTPSVEIKLTPNGIYVTGFPSETLLKKIKHMAGADE
jgi:anaerobic ribonucleoside-triphosphate reductase activating protein